MDNRTIDVRELKRIQRDLEFRNRDMAQMLGVAEATYKSWIYRKAVPRYIQYSIHNMLNLDGGTYIKLKTERGL